MDPEVIAMKVYSTLLKYPELEPSHQMQFRGSHRVVMAKVLNCKGWYTIKQTHQTNLDSV